MKKLFALVLAVAMVLSLSAVSMAAETEITTSENHATWGGILQGGKSVLYTDTDYEENPTNMHKENIPYGKTVYIPLIKGDVTKVEASAAQSNQFKSADDVSGLKVSAKWEEGAEFIESTELVKKDGYYWVAIKTTGSDLDENDVEGTITFTGKAYENASDKNKKNVNTITDDKDKNKYDVTLTMGYNDATKLEITDEDLIYKFEDKDWDEEDTELEVKDEEVTFTVDTTHQGDLVISCDTDEIDEVADKYAAANLDYYAFNGATFKKTGELFIEADEGTYLYEIVNGEAKEVDATYDEYDEGFYLKTKTLGTYVVSDVKLATASAEAATETNGTANPTTGAAL